MPAKVKLSEIAEYMDMQFDESHFYLNRETGEASLVTDEDIGAAEELSPEDYPEDERENIEMAAEILDMSNKYVALPDRYEVDMYRIMEKFCYSIEDDRTREHLCDSIIGSGAFRRFKNNIIRYGIEQDWYRFRDECLKELAREWCEENGIEYVDE